MQVTARLRNHLFRDRMPAVGPNMRPPFGLLDPQFGPFSGNHESSSLFHKDFMGRPLDGIAAPWTVKVPNQTDHYCLSLWHDASSYTLPRSLVFLF
jgi:hypothetical protein